MCQKMATKVVCIFVRDYLSLWKDVTVVINA